MPTIVNLNSKVVWILTFLTGWLFDLLTDWLTDWQTDRLIDWLTQTDWTYGLTQTDWTYGLTQTKWLTDLLSYGLTDMHHWLLDTEAVNCLGTVLHEIKTSTWVEFLNSFQNFLHKLLCAVFSFLLQSVIKWNLDHICGELQLFSRDKLTDWLIIFLTYDWWMYLKLCY